MIYLILGPNTYRQEQELHKIISHSHTAAESVDAAALTMNGLADIVRGNSLFSMQRLVIIRALSEKTDLFTKLVEWIDELSPDTTVVLVESKLDKRTKAYKTLTTRAKVIDAEVLVERDSAAAERWLQELAKQHGLVLSKEHCRQMIQRALVSGDKPSVRVVDQMQLYQAVKALQGAKEVTDDMLATVLPPATEETVFSLLELAGRGNLDQINHALASLQMVEDGYKTAALLFSQWSQLAMLVALGGDSSQIATTVGVHPYVAKKLYSVSRAFSRHDIRTITQLAASLDSDMKTSRVTPWDAIYRFIYAVAAI